VHSKNGSAALIVAGEVDATIFKLIDPTTGATVGQFFQPLASYSSLVFLHNQAGYSNSAVVWNQTAFPAPAVTLTGPVVSPVVAGTGPATLTMDESSAGISVGTTGGKQPRLQLANSGAVPTAALQTYSGGFRQAGVTISHPAAGTTIVADANSIDLDAGGVASTLVAGKARLAGTTAAVNATGGALDLTATGLATLSSSLGNVAVTANSGLTLSTAAGVASLVSPQTTIQSTAAQVSLSGTGLNILTGVAGVLLNARQAQMMVINAVAQATAAVAPAAAVLQDMTGATVTLAGVKVGDLISVDAQLQFTTTAATGAGAAQLNWNGAAIGPLAVCGIAGSTSTSQGTIPIVWQFVSAVAGNIVLKLQVRLAAGSPVAVTFGTNTVIRAQVFATV
jgi:hypothetical protein